MPRMTAKYRFEWDVLHALVQFSEKCTGTTTSFLMILGGDGAARSIHFDRPDDGWHSVTEQLTTAGTPHLLYDPFDEWIWIGWYKISRETMERLMNSGFKETAFIDAGYSSAPEREWDSIPDYPETWGVMF